MLSTRALCSWTLLCLALPGLATSPALAESMQLGELNANYLVLGVDSLESNAGEGSGDCDVKFQLSFSKRISAPLGVRQWAWVRRFGSRASLHVGATQKSWWDICRHSAPFRESNYEPSLFVRLPMSPAGPAGQAAADRNLYFGYMHESNGRDGEASTGWDRAFARYRTTLNLGTGSSVPSVDLTVWAPFLISENNADITDFVGYGELGVELRVSEYLNARLSLHKGGNLTEWERGLAELDLVIGFRRSDLKLLLQYTNGYGSSLERIEQHEYAGRIGIQFSGIGTPDR